MPQLHAPNAARRRSSVRPLADLVAPCIGPALARQGFSEADALLHWPEIVGEQLAERCRPVKLQWRPRATGAEAAIEPATLVVRVEGAFALQVQHMTAVILERVNVYFGWRCVGKIALRQGPLPVRPQATVRPDVTPGARRRAETAVAGVDDERLRAALAHLGGRVLSR